MKGLSYILSIYILLLAVFPCCAFDDCPDDKIQTQQTANHQTDDEGCGTCSPFFNCERCTLVTTIVEPVYFHIISLPVRQEYNGFLSPHIADVHYDFWQPPKLS